MLKYKIVVKNKGGSFMDSKKIKFEEYGIEFDKNEFDNMSKKDLEECDEILKKIERLVEKK